MSTRTRRTRKLDDNTLAMHAARWLAVAIILFVGGSAFVLSYSSLRGVALMARVPFALAGLLPVIVDGTILLATVGCLVLAGHSERRYFRRMLEAAAAVSLIGNGLHAGMDGHQLPWWLSVVVAAVAPVSLLAATHGLAVLFRAMAHPAADKTAPRKAAQRKRKPVAARKPAAAPARAITLPAPAALSATAPAA
jgi:hypothetical protein